MKSRGFHARVKDAHETLAFPFNSLPGFDFNSRNPLKKTPNYPNKLPYLGATADASVNWEPSMMGVTLRVWGKMLIQKKKNCPTTRSAENQALNVNHQSKRKSTSSSHACKPAPMSQQKTNRHKTHHEHCVHQRAARFFFVVFFNHPLHLSVGFLFLLLVWRRVSLSLTGRLINRYCE